MLLSNPSLSRRLERAEGHACVEFAKARRRLFPESGADWIECGGAYAVFDGIESPVTQSFGLGIFDDLQPAILDSIERFFAERGAPVFHEVSPFAGIAALDLLCRRNYRPIELSNVLYRAVEIPAIANPPEVEVRVISRDEKQLWSQVSARGWSHEHPELGDFLREFGAIAAAREGSPCFLAEHDGKAGAAAALSIHDGVALFGGSATAPEFRRRGLHTALLYERMRYAARHGCDLAMIAVQPGSDSQRNAERNGFRIAYTRTKWKLVSPND